MSTATRTPKQTRGSDLARFVEVLIRGLHWCDRHDVSFQEALDLAEAEFIDRVDPVHSHGDEPWD